MACSVSDTPSLKDLPKVATDLKSQLEGFNTSCLRDVDTNEKIVLPSAEDVATEKTQKSLFDGIEKFDSSQLKHTETQEKNPLPDKDGTFVSPHCSLYLLNARMQFAFCMFQS